MQSFGEALLPFMQNKHGNRFCSLRRCLIITRPNDIRMKQSSVFPFLWCCITILKVCRHLTRNKHYNNPTLKVKYHFAPNSHFMLDMTTFFLKLRLILSEYWGFLLRSQIIQLHGMWVERTTPESSLCRDGHVF